MAPEMFIGVPACNRFASLSEECATPAILSDSQSSITENRASPGLITVHALVPYPRNRTTPAFHSDFSTIGIP